MVEKLFNTVSKLFSEMSIVNLSIVLSVLGIVTIIVILIAICYNEWEEEQHESECEKFNERNGLDGN